MDNCRETVFSRHNRIVAHMNAAASACTGLAKLPCRKPNHGGVWYTGSPPLAVELLATDGCWGWEKQYLLFFPEEMAPEILTMLQQIALQTCAYWWYYMASVGVKNTYRAYELGKEYLW